MVYALVDPACEYHVAPQVMEAVDVQKQVQSSHQGLQMGPRCGLSPDWVDILEEADDVVVTVAHHQCLNPPAYLHLIHIHVERIAPF